MVVGLKAAGISLEQMDAPWVTGAVTSTLFFITGISGISMKP